MAFAVTEFKSNLKQGGARPSLFSVHLNYPTAIEPTPPSNSEFLIKSTSIPASTIGTHDVYFHGKALKVAGDRTFDTWDTTIINDEDFGIRIAIENWMELISDHKLNTRSTKMNLANFVPESENADWKKDIMVTQFGKDGEHKHHYHFLGAFPTALSAIPLDWASQDIEEYTVTWTYDRWMPGTKTNTKDSKEKSPIHHLFPSDEHNY